MEPIGPPDSHYVNAAIGWLELGDTREAKAEISNVTAVYRRHPEVLRVRFALAAKDGDWEAAVELARAICRKVPEFALGWVCQAYALHRLGRTQAAWDLLSGVVDQFADEYSIPYDLACYACRLGRLDEAREWVERAMRLAGPEQIKNMVSMDPDLQPLKETLES